MYVFEKYKPQNPPHQSGEQCENDDSKQCENNVSVMTTFENSTLKTMTENWNTTAVDYFVYYKSSKYSRFNAKCLHLPKTVEDIFTQYWLKQSVLKFSHPQPETNLEVLGF